MLHFEPQHRKPVLYGQALPAIENYQISYVNKPRKQKTTQRHRPTEPSPIAVSNMPSSDMDFIQSIIKNGGTPLAFAEDLPSFEQELFQTTEPIVIVDKDFTDYIKAIKQISSKDILAVKVGDIESYVNQTFQIKNADLSKNVRSFFTAVYTSTYLSHLVDDSVVSHLAHCL